MTINSHRPTTSQAWRLVLARCSFDDHAEDIVRSECTGVWREIANQLLDITATLLADRSGAGIRFAERQTELAVYCEARDRDNLPADIGIIDRQLAIWDAFERERAS